MNELVTKTDLTASMEHLTLRLTVRMGMMLAAAIAILGAVIKIGAS